MRALVYDDKLRLLFSFPQPEPSAGEALIRVSLAGICNTDLEITQGYMCFHGVLGHEFVGTVVQAEDPAWIGRRVVGEINCACDVCATCLRGDAPHCPRRTTLGIGGRDGALAEYCLLPPRNLHSVPDLVSDRQAVFVEPLAAALEIPERLHIRPSEQVVVIGDGKLGLLVAQVLRLTGCALQVVGRHQNKLDILTRQGIDVVLEEDVTGVHQADVVVDCTGNPAGFALARRLVRPRGRLVLKSTVHEGVDRPETRFFPKNLVSLSESLVSSGVNLSTLVVDEVSVIGSRCGPFGPALRLLALGLIDTESLIEAVFPLDQGLAAFARASRKGALKVLVQP